MKLVVGLGNPGRKYRETRHNVGYKVLEVLAERYGRGGPRTAFQGLCVDADVSAERVVLLQPETYMNKSGASVARAKDFYKLGAADLLIVCDDFNLPLAKLRFRAKGSAGGQKGLEDIIRCLGGDEFPRLRIGIGPVPPGRDPADFVLGRFTDEEGREIEPTVVRASDAVGDWIRSGIDYCMNQYNG
jgi:PTH1 family peptidyl-tRNA hydrolase